MKTKPVILSSNPVQQSYITTLLDLFQDNSDDLYDFANYIDALRKTADHLIRVALNYNDGEGDFVNTLNYAMGDWKESVKSYVKEPKFKIGEMVWFMKNGKPEVKEIILRKTNVSEYMDGTILKKSINHYYSLKGTSMEYGGERLFPTQDDLLRSIRIPY